MIAPEPLPEWSPMTRAWWERVWAQPFADRYVETDVYGLRTLARLVERYIVEPTQELRDETLAWAERFGLTPASRVDLGWAIEAKPSAGDVDMLVKERGGHRP